MNENARFAGVWRLLSAMQNGRDVTSLCDSEVVYYEEGPRLLVQSCQGGPLGACRLDATTDPHHIDLTHAWRGTEFVTYGIYRFDGEELVLCFGGSQRPDSFDGTIPDGRIVYRKRRAPTAPGGENRGSE